MTLWMAADAAALSYRSVRPCPRAQALFVSNSMKIARSKMPRCMKQVKRSKYYRRASLEGREGE